MAELQKIPTSIEVVAAALTNASGHFLLQKRAPGGRHGGLWEFPGGKVEEGELPENALSREIEEELALRIDGDSLAPAGRAGEAATEEFPAIVMTLYTVGAWSGTPVGLQGQEWGWFSLEEASRLPMPAADVALLDSLRLIGR